MPTRQPTKSFQELRDYMEKWSWIDPMTGYRTTGYNPPADAKGKKQVPFYFKAVTLQGHVIDGNAVCLKVITKTHSRLIKFVESGECRWIKDYLVMEVDGARIVTH